MVPRDDWRSNTYTAGHGSKLTEYIATYSWPWIQLQDELLEDCADDGELTDKEDADGSSPNAMVSLFGTFSMSTMSHPNMSWR